MCKNLCYTFLVYLITHNLKFTETFRNKLLLSFNSVLWMDSKRKNKTKNHPYSYSPKIWTFEMLLTVSIIKMDKINETSYKCHSFR